MCAPLRPRALLIAAVACVALGPSPASNAKGARYALIENDWGSECYGSYDHTADMVVPFGGRPAHPVLDHLDTGRLRSLAYVSRDRSRVAWARGRTLWLGDLLTGRSHRFGRVAGSAAIASFSLAPGERAAILESADEPPRLTLVTRDGARVVRRTVAESGYAKGLSADGRFVAYPVTDGIVVRALDGGAPTPIAGSGATWSPAGHRLAYVSGASLQVDDPASSTPALDAPLPTATPEGDVSLSWSPDGRFVLITDDVDVAAPIVVDVATRSTVQLPGGADDPTPTWRPRHGHQLLRGDTAAGVSDVVDVATPAELWLRPVEQLEWSPSGRWLLSSAFSEPKILDAAGHPARLPAAVRAWEASGFSWLGDQTLVTDDTQVLRFARPPAWRQRVLTRAGTGHTLSAQSLLTATPAGLRLLARTFRSPARTRDCAR